MKNQHANKDLHQLALQYGRMLDQVRIPGFELEDLLDLVDYYIRMGCDFEAQVYKRIAEKLYPNNSEVLLLASHWCADDGNWLTADQLQAVAEIPLYDRVLLQMEKKLRLFHVADAVKLMEGSLPAYRELPDYDMLYDSAELFRDFGYLDIALECLAQIPSSYIDYHRVSELRAECLCLNTHFAEAIQVINAVLDENPFDDCVWIQAATIAERGQDYDKAMEACEYALAINQENQYAHKIKNILLQQTRVGTADVQAAIERQDYEELLSLGDIAFNAQKYSDASELYRLSGYFLPRAHRTRIEISKKIAISFIYLSQPTEALSVFRAILGLGGDIQSVYLDGARVFIKQGYVAEAITLLDILIRSGEHNSESLEKIIELLSIYQCYHPAIRLWQKIFACSEELPNVLKRHVQTAKETLGE